VVEVNYLLPLPPLLIFDIVKHPHSGGVKNEMKEVMGI